MDDLRTYGRGSNWGWIIGAFVLGPILLYLFNIFFMGGDETARAYADRYIRDSDTIEVEIPQTDHLDIKFEVYTTALSRYGGGGNNKTYKRYIFYSPKYKRYLALVTFWGYNAYRSLDLKGRIY